MPKRSDPLDAYKAKRDFKKTPEPPPARGNKPGRSFVIQKHDATRLHFDFRLEHDGVLKSWAVTRGPSVDPAEKRLAVRTEDHPLVYGQFEGVIPKGEYGGGSVMLWDRGTWEPEYDPDYGFEKGHLAFTLHGDRLKGKWHLVRMKGQRKGDGKRENWLLIKSEDEEANAPDPTRAFETSVASGRKMDQIAADPDAVWHSNRSADEQPAAEPKSRGVWGGPKRKASRKAGKGEFVAPQLASASELAPSGQAWLHEIKYDGYRLIAHKQGKRIALFTRNGFDWTDRFPGIAKALDGLKAKSALLDGEAAYVKPDGVTDFKSLQDRIDSADPAIRYFLFDLLELDGKSLLKTKLTERKAKLKALLEKSKSSPLLIYSDHVEGNGPSFLNEACGSGLEGIVSKKADGTYVSGRTKSWLKIKCGKRSEFVIGGYSKSSARPFASLLLGTFENGELRYAGKVGTGFSDAKMEELAALFAKRARKTSPFADIPKTEAKGASWVEPELIAEVSFTEQTRDGRLRHPSFEGLREDKRPKQVQRESAMADAGVKTKKQKDETEVEGVRLTHPDKVLWPDAGLTKLDLAEYYGKVEDWIGPYVFDRPISLVRCPDGQQAECFFQRHAMQGMSGAIKTVPIRDSEAKADYLYVDSAAGLVGLVQIGTLEIHDWGCRVDDPEKPDRLVFDLDPDEGLDFEVVKAAAVEVREFLTDLGLKSFLRTSGGKGLHVVAPIARNQDWDAVKGFALGVAEALAAARPARYTANLAKKARKGRLFVDYLRNQRGGTAIANYSSRARPGAPVAVPLRWDELKALADAHPYTIETLPARLKRLKGDPWADYASTRQAITAKMLKILGLK